MADNVMTFENQVAVQQRVQWRAISMLLLRRNFFVLLYVHLKRKRKQQPSIRRPFWTDPLAGINKVYDFFERPDMHPQRTFNFTRMSREGLVRLLLELQTTERFVGKRQKISHQEKLLMFLMIVMQGSSLRLVAEFFQHAWSTIGTSFHQVIGGLLELYPRYVRLPTLDEANAHLRQYPGYLWPYFENCIGAIDGTHIPVGPQSKDSWRNRKGWYSQNVLACCDWDMNFTYIYAGMEGSAHDVRVLSEADVRARFRDQIPDGAYFLADAGYPPSHPFMMVPYMGTRYHLKEYHQGSEPRTAKELFNRRHSSKRTTIERTFGVFKGRFRVYKGSTINCFSVSSQVALLYALVCLHNFMNQHRQLLNPEDDGTFDNEEVDDDPPPEGRRNGSLGSKRDEMAEAMWRDY